MECMYENHMMHANRNTYYRIKGLPSPWLKACDDCAPSPPSPPTPSLPAATRGADRSTTALRSTAASHTDTLCVRACVPKETNLYALHYICVCKYENKIHYLVFEIGVFTYIHTITITLPAEVLVLGGSMPYAVPLREEGKRERERERGVNMKQK